jgi:hypothetical protein
MTTFGQYADIAVDTLDVTGEVPTLAQIGITISRTQRFIDSLERARWLELNDQRLIRDQVIRDILDRSESPRWVHDTQRWDPPPGEPCPYCGRTDDW